MLSAPVGSPDETAFSLSWTAPEECPDEGAVVDAISRSLVSSERGAPPVHAVANVTKRDDRYNLDFELRQGVDSGRRQIDSESCAELADLTAWFVAVAVDPRLTVRPRVQVPTALRVARERTAESGDAPAGAPSEEKEPPSIPAPPAQEPPRRAPPRRGRALRGVVAAGAGIEANVLPSVGAAFSLTAGLEWGAMRWELAGWYALPRDQVSPENARVGGTFQGGAAALRGCGVPRAKPVLFPLCLAVEAGGIFGEGSGDLEPARATAIWAGLGPMAGVVWRFSKHVGLRLDGEAVISLVRPTFSSTPSGVVFQPGAIGARATAGFEFVLP